MHARVGRCSMTQSGVHYFCITVWSSVFFLLFHSSLPDDINFLWFLIRFIFKVSSPVKHLLIVLNYEERLLYKTLRSKRNNYIRREHLMLTYGSCSSRMHML